MSIISALVLVDGCATNVSDQSHELAAEAGSSSEVVGVTQALVASARYGQARLDATNQPLNAVLAVSPGNWANSGTGVPTVVRSGTGTYTVDFPNGFVTGNAGNVQVTAHGMFVNNKQVGQHCKVVDWRKATNNNDLFVFVACHSADGTPSNSTFSVVWHRETFSGGPRGAYVWANKPTTASYTPSTSNQWNSTGGTNTITRASTGNYTVSLPGQASAGGNVQVTAFGSDASYCKTTGWSLGSNGKVNVGVRCFAASGSPVDSMFTLDFEYTPLTYFGIGGFLWADQPNSEDYVPNLAYSINTESDVVNEAGAIAFSSNSMIYGVTYDLLTIDDSVHMVTAYGLNADYCFTTLDLVQCNAPPGKTMNGDLYSDRMNSVLDF